jgi:hypothetical protein
LALRGPGDAPISRVKRGHMHWRLPWVVQGHRTARRRATQARNSTLPHRLIAPLRRVAAA